MPRNFGIPPRPGVTYPEGCDWAKPPGCTCKRWAQAQACCEFCYQDLHREREPDWVDAPNYIGVYIGVAVAVILSIALALLLS